MNIRIIKPHMGHEEAGSQDDLAEGTLTGPAVRWESDIIAFTPVSLLREQGSPSPAFFIS